jgi:hypothetical protein
MQLTISRTLLFASLLALSACGSSGNPESSKQEETSTASTEEEWTVLFDGSSLEGWRGFNSDSVPPNWVIEDGTLKALGTGGDIGGDLVYGAEAYDNFELSFEWKISEGGNSGVFYHVVEGEQYKAPYETGPEYQVLDDAGFPDPLEDWQKAGADYAMYVPDPGAKKLQPAGQWNTSRIYFSDDRAEYWLNGEKVVEFVPWSEEWTERRNSGKWDDFPDYGLAKTGLIGLQDHGDVVWYRNVKIREL